MTGLSIGHGSQNMVEIESVTRCTRNKLSLWNEMIDLQRWRLHLEWGLFLPSLRDIYWNFLLHERNPSPSLGGWKEGYGKNVTKRFSFSFFSPYSMVQFDRKALEILLKSVTLFGSYHCLSLSPRAFKLSWQALTEASEVWEQESYGQRWYDIKARMVNRRDRICQLSPQY